MITAEFLVAKVQEGIPGATAKAQDLTGGGDHWRMEVVAAAFADKSLIEQHQMVYQALGELMRREIHALQLSTRTP
jgi:stress-induced morphogen